MSVPITRGESAAPGPLSGEHLAAIAAARLRGKKVRRAANVAAFSGWTMAFFALITLMGGLWGDVVSIVLGVALSIVTVNELRGAARIRRFDPSGARLLGWNQIGLGCVLVVYGIFSLVMMLRNPAAVLGGQSSGDAQVDQMMTDMVGGFTSMIAYGLYGGVAIFGVIGPGLTAWYYFSREKVVRRFVEETPGWVVGAMRWGERDVAPLRSAIDSRPRNIRLNPERKQLSQTSVTPSSAEYTRIATQELLRCVPELREFRVRLPSRRMSFSELRTVSRVAYGRVNEGRGAIHHWFIQWLERWAPREAEFRVADPCQSRSLQVIYAYPSSSLRPFDIRVIVDGSTRRVRLECAGALALSDHRWTREEAAANLRAAHYPCDPAEDARFVAQHVRSVFDGELGVLRIVRCAEIGMGGLEVPGVLDVISDRDGKSDFHVSLDDAAEAIWYSWRGETDRHVIEPRYTEEQLRDRRWRCDPGA